MKQLKPMGISGIILLIICLATTNGFLESDRRIYRQKPVDSKRGDFTRNFFGNTWQRSSAVLERNDGPNMHNDRNLDETRARIGPSDNRRAVTDRRNIKNDINIERFSEERRSIRIVPTVRNIDSRHRIHEPTQSSRFRSVRTLDRERVELPQNTRRFVDRRDVQERNQRERHKNSPTLPSRDSRQGRVGADHQRILERNSRVQQIRSSDPVGNDRSQIFTDRRDTRNLNVHLLDRNVNTRRSTDGRSNDRRQSREENRESSLQNRNQNTVDDRDRRQNRNVRNTRVSDANNREFGIRSSSRNDNSGRHTVRLPIWQQSSGPEERRRSGIGNDRVVRVNSGKLQLSSRLSTDDRKLSRVSDSRRESVNVQSSRDLRNKLDDRQRDINIHNLPEYNAEMKSNMFTTTMRILLMSFLIAQVMHNSCKAKRKWVTNLTNIIAATKEKVF